jgi:hypothetical protein
MQNDITIWEQSPILKSILDGTFATLIDFPFEMGGRHFTQLWWLADGIYPSLARFSKTLDEPCNNQLARYATWQEAARKDIERAFGVLQLKFQCVARPVNLHHPVDITNMINACVIMHNMMVEHRVSLNERDNTNFYGVHTCEDDTSIHEDRAVSQVEMRQAADAIVNRARGGVDMQDEQPANNEDRHDPLNMQARIDVVQARWSHLTDNEEHYRLRIAIVNEINKNTNETEQDAEEEDEVDTLE